MPIYKKPREWPRAAYSAVVGLLAWVVSQTRGTARNLRVLISRSALDDYVPNAVEGFVYEVLDLVPKALGFRGARNQVYGSVTLAILAILSSFISAGATLVLLVPLVFTLSIGLLRMVPWVDSKISWGVEKTRLDRDRDVPGWRRE